MANKVGGSGVPDSTDIVNRYKGIIEAIEDINKIFVQNKNIVKELDLIIRFNNKQLPRFARSIESFSKSFILSINSVQTIDAYIKQNAYDFLGFQSLTDILNNFLFTVNGLHDSVNKEVTLDSKKIAKDILKVVDSLRYISFIALNSAKIINPGLDELMGDSNSYLALFSGSNNIYRSGKSNNSILFRFFLLNDVIDKITKISTSKGGWLKSFIFWNFTIKSSIRRMVNTLYYFIKQSRKITKVMKGVSTDNSDNIKNMIDSMMNFSGFLNILDASTFSLKEILRYRRKIRRIFGLVKYFIKKMKKANLEIEILMANPEISESFKYLTEGVVNLLNAIDMITKLNIIKRILAVRRFRKLVKILTRIPLALVDGLDKEDLDASVENINQLAHIVEVLSNISFVLSHFNFKEKKLAKLLMIINKINSNFAKLKEEKLVSSLNNLKLINSILKNVLVLAGTLTLIGIFSITAIIGFLFIKFILPEVLKTITTLSKKYVSKKKSITELCSILGELIKTLTAFTTAFGAMAVIGIPALIGAGIVTLLLFVSVGSFLLLAVMIEKFKKKHKSKKGDIIDSTCSTLIKIAGTIAAFSEVLNMATKSGISVVGKAIILQIEILVFIGIYLLTCKLVSSKSKVISKGNRVLLKISTSLLNFSMAIKNINENVGSGAGKNLTLLIGCILLMTGIFFVLNKIDLKIKRGAKIMLKMALALAGFVLSLALLSLFTITASPVIFLGLGMLILVIAGIVGIFYLINKFKKDILIGGVVLLVITGIMVLVAIGIALMYAAVSNITNWEAMGFLYANIIAMAIASMGIGFLLTSNPELFLWAAAGLITLIGISASFVLIGENIGKCFRGMGEVDWEAMGFLYANVGAMAVAAGGIGAVIMLTAGLAAAAIAAGVTAMIGISASFILIGENISKLYGKIGSIPNDAKEKSNLMLAPLYAITRWVESTSWDDILWLPKGTSALVDASDNLLSIGKKMAETNKISGLNNSALTFSRIAYSMKTFAELDHKKVKKGIDQVVENIKYLSSSEFDLEGVNRIDRAFNSTNSFLTKVQSIDINKLDRMAVISGNMAKFATSINGNFDALADALNEKLVKAMEQLNLTLDQIREVLDEVNGSLTESTESITKAVETKNTTDQAAAADDKNKKVDPEVRKALEKIQKILSQEGISIKNDKYDPMWVRWQQM